MKPKRSLIGWLAGGALAVSTPVLIEWYRARSPVTVDVVVVAADSVKLSLTATGTLVPAVSADVGSRTTGTLVDLRVVEGQFVRQGTILGRIAPENGIALSESARGARREAMARIQSAETAFDQDARRLQRLQAMAEGAAPLVSVEDIEAAEHAVRSSRAVLEGARAGLAQAEAAVREAEHAEQRVLVIAPFDGVVTSIHRRRGETVVPATYGGENSRILTLAQLERGTVTIPVPERHALEMDPNDPVSAALLTEPNRKLRLSVGRVRPRQLLAGTPSGFEADLQVAPDTGRMPWGATVLVRVQVLRVFAERVVPLAALVTDPHDATKVGVYVLTDGRVRYQRVEVAQYGDASAALADGPSSGTMVILPPVEGDVVVHPGLVATPRRSPSGASDRGIPR